MLTASWSWVMRLMHLMLGWRAIFLELRERERERLLKFTEESCICLLHLFPQSAALVSDVYWSGCLVELLPSLSRVLDLASCAHTFVTIERAVQATFSAGVPGAGLRSSLFWAWQYPLIRNELNKMQAGSKLCKGIYFIYMHASHEYW